MFWHNLADAYNQGNETKGKWGLESNIIRNIEQLWTDLQVCFVFQLDSFTINNINSYLLV